MIRYPNDIRYKAIITYKDDLVGSYFEITYVLDSEAFMAFEERPEYWAMDWFEEMWENYMDYFVDPTEVSYAGYKLSIIETDHTMN